MKITDSKENIYSFGGINFADHIIGNTSLYQIINQELGEFTIGSIKATADTKISVLGQNDKVLEYNPDANPKSRFKQTNEGC
jgi:hypothetical protein